VLGSTYKQKTLTEWNSFASGKTAAYPVSDLSRKVMLFPVESDRLFSLMDYLRPVLLMHDIVVSEQVETVWVAGTDVYT
jgi:hypothetical protein